MSNSFLDHLTCNLSEALTLGEQVTQGIEPPTPWLRGRSNYLQDFSRGQPPYYWKIATNSTFLLERYLILLLILSDLSISNLLWKNKLKPCSLSILSSIVEILHSSNLHRKKPKTLIDNNLIVFNFFSFLISTNIKCLWSSSILKWSQVHCFMFTKQLKKVTLFKAKVIF